MLRELTKEAYDMIKTACLRGKKGGVIAARYSETGYVLLADAEELTEIGGFSREGMTDTEMAERFIEEDCEVIITGPIEKEPFEIIADRGMITRYNGVGLEAGEAKSG